MRYAFLYIKYCLFDSFSGIYKAFGFVNNLFITEYFQARIRRSIKLQMMEMVLQTRRPPKSTSKIKQNSITLGDLRLLEVQ